MINKETTKLPVIGIDLGTTNSCVAIVDSSGPKVIPNGKGFRTTPSVVCYMNDRKDVQVGLDAIRQSLVYPEAVVYEAKRAAGRNYKKPEDAAVLNDHSKNVGYKILEGKDGQPIIRVTPVEGSSFDTSPVEASATILRKLKDDICTYLGVVNSTKLKVVITVPSYFNDAQRQATKDAGEIAGFEVLRIINEPTAAALAYYSSAAKDFSGEMNVAVYDFGGGTFDISIAQISRDEAEDDPLLVEIKATSGDTHLGGVDVDTKLFEYLKQKVGSLCSGVDLTNPYFLQKIRQIAEETKKSLSHSPVVNISEVFGFDKNGKPMNFEAKITQSELEQLAAPIIERTRKACQTALADAEKKGVKKIDVVILVGGMTRMPLVQRVAASIFLGATIKKDVNPDEVVALGAAVQASVLCPSEDSSIGQKILLSDVTSLSTGIETLNGVFTIMIPRGTPVPTQRSEVFTTAADNQPEVHIKVYQGERTVVSGNVLIGDFTLSGIKPAPRGVPQIEVTFSTDVNGILTVSAIDKQTNETKSIQIKNITNMDPAEKERLIKEAEANSRQDAARLEIAKTISSAEMGIYDAKAKLNEYGEKIEKELKAEIDEKILAVERPLDSLKLQYSNSGTDPEGSIKDVMKEVQDRTSELMAVMTKASSASSPQEEHPQA